MRQLRHVGRDASHLIGGEDLTNPLRFRRQKPNNYCCRLGYLYESEAETGRAHIAAALANAAYVIGHALGWHVGFCCCVRDRYERQLFFERQLLMDTVLILELS